MRFLILTVLLSITQTSSPIPRQTPDRTTNTGAHNQAQAKKDKGNSHAAENGDADAEHPVTVSKLPPLTILPAKRDWVDRAYWGFSGLLAVTGLFQIWLLWRTLKVTSKQADIAKGQEDQMIAAGQQTERIIAQMKEAEVRDLRAYIGVSSIILIAQNRLKPQALVEFRNFGKTPAYNVRQWVGIAPQSYPLTVTLPDSPNVAGSVATMYPSVPNRLETELKKEFPQGTEDQIGTPTLSIYVYGKVIYDDVFGNQWHTNYRFIFGGAERGRLYRDKTNILCGEMHPYSDGNDAI